MVRRGSSVMRSGMVASRQAVDFCSQLCACDCGLKTKPEESDFYYFLPVDGRIVQFIYSEHREAEHEQNILPSTAGSVLPVEVIFLCLCSRNQRWIISHAYLPLQNQFCQYGRLVLVQVWPAKHCHTSAPEILSLIIRLKQRYY